MVTLSFMTLALIGLALVFDFINGFHDAANSTATVVSTKVMGPKAAVAWAALFNFLAVFVYGTAVASTVGKGIVDPSVVDNHIILAGLVGAITWGIVTWGFGLPSSSSHALVGGLVGAALCKGGTSALLSAGILKVCLFIVVSPMIGFCLGFVFMLIALRISRGWKQDATDFIFRKGQFVSAALYSLGHGGNDAQKTAGIIYALLIAAGQLTASDGVPFWVLLLCHGAMALGTAFGGWKIVRTMGKDLTELQPPGGFASELSGAATLAINSAFGIPASTTHAITGAIVGTGTARSLDAVQWNVASRITIAWIITIPAAASVAALAYLISGFLM